MPVEVVGEKMGASALMTAGPFVDGGRTSSHILAAMWVNLCPGRAFFEQMRDVIFNSFRCFAMFKKSNMVISP